MYLEVASRVAMIVLLPLAIWLTTSVQKHEVWLAEIRSSRFTSQDGLRAQAQINELAITTQAAIDAIRERDTRQDERLDDLESRH